MTTEPALPPGAGAESLPEALSGLVGEGVLSPAQADAVLARLSRPTVSGAMAPGPWGPPRSGVIAGPPNGSSASGTLSQPFNPAGADRLRPAQRLVEVVAYLGVAFVLGGMALVLGPYWSHVSRGTKTLAGAVLSVLCLGTGAVTGWPVRGRQPRTPEEGTRFRAASVLLCAGAALAGFTIALPAGYQATWWSPSLVFGVVLSLLLFGYSLVRTELAELGLGLTAGVFTTSTVMGVLHGHPVAQDRAATITLLVLGAVWAWFLARRMVARSTAVGVGLVMMMASSSWTSGQLVRDLVLVAVAVAAIASYLRDPLWTWAVGAVLCATIVMFDLVGDQLGPSMGFVVAGLVLLAGCGLAAVLQRRTPSTRTGRGSA